MPRIFSKCTVAATDNPVVHKRQSVLADTLHKRMLPLACLLIFLIAATLVIGQSAPPAIPPINLSADPLFAATGGDKPVIALTLSVEYPTVGAQYVTAVSNATTDATYTNTNEYLGYYDAESCYNYNDSPTESPVDGLASTDYKRFDRSGISGSGSTLHMCANAFSGNFLNWASSSAIDMLRLALSGGDRYIDTANLTILQRAVLPDGDPATFWNSANFPGKQLLKTGGISGTAYFGAVPTAMAKAAGNNDIWIANVFNRIYFGTAKVGNNSGSAGNYTLGAPSNAASYGPVVNPYASFNTAQTSFGGSVCASEGSNCSFTGVKEVLYGGQGTSPSNGGWISFPANNGVTCSNTFSGSFIDPAPGTTKQCFIRPYTGSWKPNTTSSQLNSEGYFFSRVQVCNMSGGILQDVRDYGLCKQYPNGNFKPTGSIQKYSDQLRLAAFGYLMDQTDSNSGGRYGGVLRAPMKFVGAKTFDITGQDDTPVGGNSKREWELDTGVFIANPDNDLSQTIPISGVVNYLNKFGRTGPSPGRYKIYDPVGELYYETLRYLQGLQPTVAAVSGLTPAMYDGFPVLTSWDDPYGGARSATSDYSCLKSNIVVIGDVNTHDGNRLPTPNPTNNVPDINAWTKIVRNFENNISSNYLDGQSVTRSTANPNNANASAPGNQVIGAAYWAHTHDIRGTNWTANTAQQRPGLRTKTFFFDVNEYGNSTLGTGSTDSYRRYRNQFFTAAKYGGFESDAGNIGGKPYNAFGNPFKRQNGMDDNNVWQDPTRPDEASTYYLQSSARGVLNAFDSIFSRAATSARSIAGAATAGKSLVPSGSNATYQASFDTSDWSGDVISVPLSITSTNIVAVGATSWSAATRLSLLTAPVTTRNIIIGRPGAIASPIATNFTWAEIDTAMQENLAKTTPFTPADTLGQNRLNFLRGDKANEGTLFRTRSKLLGDIVNSGIAFSGSPAASVANTATYTSFYTANAARPAALFVGANDGIMHAFNANTGDELFGYIPSWMGTKLAALSSKTYAGSHQAYVDGTPTVAEAQVGTSGTSSDWKTVLVSGTGAGGSGIFALDVTDPTTFSASKVMWEFTRADDADLGYVVGKPYILKLRTSAPGNATPTYRWFAVVASGVSNYVPDSLFNGAYSSTGNPALFLIALDKVVGTPWSLGSNYYKISIPADLASNRTSPTGLINFLPISAGIAGELTQIYMGDLQGQLWKLDFSLRAASEWSLDKLSPFKRGGTAPFTPYPLYIARSGTNTIQSISMAPTVVPGPKLGGLNTAYITFATGKYLEATDKTSTVQNSIYEIFDNGSTGGDSTPLGASAISGRGRLKAGTINISTGVVDTPTFVWGRAANDSDLSQRSGIYVDFSSTGERGITNIKVAGNNLQINSLIPASSGAVGSCAAAGGDGKSYQINYLSAKGSVQNSTTGLLGEPLVIDLPASTTYTRSATTGQRTKTTIQQVIQQGSLGVATGGTVTTTAIAGRLSWRQINNYQDLKNAP